MLKDQHLTSREVAREAEIKNQGIVAGLGLIYCWIQLTIDCCRRTACEAGGQAVRFLSVLVLLSALVER